MSQGLVTLPGRSACSCLIEEIRPLVRGAHKHVVAGEGRRPTAIGRPVVIKGGAEEALDGFQFSTAKVIEIRKFDQPLASRGLRRIFGMQIRECIGKPLVRSQDAPHGDLFQPCGPSKMSTVSILQPGSITRATAPMSVSRPTARL